MDSNSEQTKKWDTKIVVLERYSEYKRKHVLRINPSSLPNLEMSSRVDETAQKEFRESFEAFAAFVEDLRARKVIPTMEIETRLTAIAKKAGIIIACDSTEKDPAGVENPKELVSFFNKAQVFVGSDGARSVTRNKIFKDAAPRHDLRHVIQIKYHIRGEGHHMSKFPAFKAKKITGNFIQENIGTYDEETDKTPATLQIFINKETFKKLEHKATSSAPLTLKQLEQEDLEVAQQITYWLAEKQKRYHKNILLGEEQISVIPLGHYRSQQFTLDKKGKKWCLVGDAAFGVPFFRSLNNGLLCGTQLADSTANFLNRNSRAFRHYESYTRKLANKEIRLAQVKGFFLKIYSFFIKLFNPVKWLSKQWSEEIQLPD